MLQLVVAVIVQSTVFRKVTASKAPDAALARINVALSLICWFGIGMAGRIIGFI